MTIFRAALIGLGAMGRNHARIMRGLEVVEFMGAYDPAHSQSDAKDFHIFESITELIASKPDFCVIATPTTSHEEIAIQLIKADISLLVEKPLAVNSTAANNILLEFERKELFGAVGHIERFNSAVINAKKLIDEGLIGDIVQISTKRVGPFPARISDVGVVLDLASHDIDLVQFLGSAKLETINAHTKNTTLGGHEDLVVMVGLLSSGVLVNQITNWITPKKKREVVILGTRGTLEINTLNSELIYTAHGTFQNKFTEVAHINGVNPGHRSEIAFEIEEPLLREYLEFIKGLRGEQSSSVTLREGFKVVSIAESILLSSNTRTAVQIKL